MKIYRHSGQISVVRELPDCVTEKYREHAITVWYEYLPGSTGARERPSGRKLEPDWPPEVDITDARDVHDIDMLPTLSELGLLEGIEQEIFRYLHAEPEE